ncbi:MAG: hypothetical protein FWE57_03550 [Chitinispirillia bacterium]|nr:hypothetical protein [Chitinispirillia bacterium]
MNLYTRTIVLGLFCFTLIVIVMITLKPITGDSSSSFSQNSEFSTNTANSISDDELAGFLNVNTAIISLKEYLRGQLLSIVNEHGMTKERYNQIAAMENDPQTVSDASVHERETARIISEKIAELQFEIQQQASSIISEQQLTAERFAEIAELLLEDSALQLRFDKLAESMKHSRKTAREFHFSFCLSGQNTAIQTLRPFYAE